MPATVYPDLDAAVDAMYGHGIREIITHRADATGDISHVVSAMALQADLGVIVADGAVNGGVTDGQGAARIGTPLADHFGLGAARVGYVDFRPNAIPALSRDRRHTTAVGNRVQLRKLTRSSRIVRESLAGDPGGMALIQNQMRGADFDAGGPDPAPGTDDAAIMEFWDRPDVLSRNTVVLWGRLPAPNGQHDGLRVSYRGFLDLCTALCPDRQVIIAGDYEVPAPGSALAGIHQQILDTGAILLGRYWQLDPGRWTRNNQVRLFHVLRAMLNDFGLKMVHVGMRSGGLDMFALSGQRTIYVVGPRTGDQRMEQVAVAVSTVPNAHMARVRTENRRLNADNAPAEGQGFAPATVDRVVDAVDVALA